MLHDRHGLQADQIQTRGPNEWLIVVNSPTVVFERLMYAQTVYLVSYTAPDRSGKAS